MVKIGEQYVGIVFPDGRYPHCNLPIKSGFYRQEAPYPHASP
jgi:hypothetical protein